MEELDAGVRDLHERVGRLDELLQSRDTAADLSEKLGAAAMDSAEATQRRQRWIVLVVALGLLIWTPATAYWAVWAHELVRNTCYVYDGAPDPLGDHWYCGLFPGTGPTQHH